MRLGLLDEKAREANLPPTRITSGARGFAKQAKFWLAYKNSPTEARAKYGIVARPAPMGYSRHHPYFDGKAAAVDVVVDEPNPTLRARKQEQLGQLAGACGLRWGGNWGDPVHFELLMVGGKLIDPSVELVRLAERLDRLSGFVEELG